MKTVLQLLESAPMDQSKRIQIAFNAIAIGKWEDAAFSLQNAARESEGLFAEDCSELAIHCQKQAKQ